MLLARALTPAGRRHVLHFPETIQQAKGRHKTFQLVTRFFLAQSMKGCGLRQVSHLHCALLVEAPCYC